MRSRSTPADGGAAARSPARRGIGGCLLALLLALPVSSGRPARPDGEEGVQERIARLWRVVREGPEAQGWAEAVAALRGATGEDGVDAFLGTLLDRPVRAWARAVERIDALVADLGDGEVSARYRETWEEARRAACDWIFDEERFPVPEKVVITGPMEGYAEAKQRGDEAAAAWKPLARRLDRALAPALRLSGPKAERLAADLATAQAACRPLLDAMSVAARTAFPAPTPDPLAVVLLGLARGDFRSASEHYAGLAPGWRRLCLFRAWSAAVLAWNEKHRFDMRRDAADGILAINEYRQVLGISPVKHDGRLVRAARGHAEEMTRLGYFSHRSPTPGRETKEQRVRIEGYEANVVECITGVGGGPRAVEFWKYDGGHHRDMVDPRWVEGGFSTRGPATYLGGAGTDRSVPVLRY